MSALAGSRSSARWSADVVRISILLAAATGALGFGVLFVSTPMAQEDAVERRYELIFVLLLGLLGISSLLYSRRRLTWPLVLLPCYVAFQVVPLPLPLIRVLSPARAELADSLAAVMAVPRFASLSVAPSVTFRHLSLVIAYVLTFVIAADAMSRLRHWPWLVICPILGVSLVEAVMGLAQKWAGPPGAFAHGTYLIRNHLAGLLEMAFPFAMMYPIAVIMRPGKSVLKDTWSLALACLGMTAAVMLLMATLVSLSRMGLVATALACVIMGGLVVTATWAGSKRLLGVAAVCAAGLAIFFLLPPLGLVQRFAGGDESRVAVWQDSLSLIRAFPIFGCGLGGYESAFPRYKTSLLMFNQDYAHNDYLQGLAELGIAGFGIIATLAILALRSAVRSIRSDETRYFGIACVGAITAIAVHSAADFNLYVPANAAVLAWILGISVSVL